MEENELAGLMADTAITYSDREDQTGPLPWNEHPRFKGVSMKHLVRGQDTDGKLSCHMVRLAPGSVLQEHSHEDQWELHEVIAGDGLFTLEKREVVYIPGRMSVIPRGMRHKVAAGPNGLVLLAKFFPAMP